MAISADIKLSIYNGALFRLAGRTIATLSEAREPRRVLDNFWGGANELVSYGLERGDWNFALRSSQLEPDTAIETAWGWANAYSKPSDFRRISSLSSDDRFQDILTAQQYTDEAGYWLTDNDPLFVRYVSDDPDYGFNSGLWTQGFRDYLETRLAWLACYRITNDKALKRELKDDMKMALKNAKSVDAMEEGVKFLPHGNWSRSRQGSGNHNRDRSTSLP